MKMERDGEIKNMGESGVSQGSLSVYAKAPPLGTEVPPLAPFWVMAVV